MDRSRLRCSSTTGAQDQHEAEVVTPQNLHVVHADHSSHPESSAQTPAASVSLPVQKSAALAPAQIKVTTGTPSRSTEAGTKTANDYILALKKENQALQTLVDNLQPAHDALKATPVADQQSASNADTKGAGSMAPASGVDTMQNTSPSALNTATMDVSAQQSATPSEQPDSLHSVPSPTPDNAADALKPKSNAPAKVDSVQAHAAVQTPPVMKHPLHDTPFRVGVRWDKGWARGQSERMSSIEGQGVWMQYRFWQQLALELSADWMSFDYSSKDTPKEWNNLNLPPIGPGHHDFKLKQVDANMRMQHYAVGAAYCRRLVGRFWGSVGIAHAWAHLPSRKILTIYEEEPHGPFPNPHPEHDYFVTNSQARWTSNYWKASAGLQFETRNLSLGLKVDYTKLATRSDPFLDATFASVSAAYKF